MTAIAAPWPQTLRPVRRFFRTPKGIFLVVLGFVALLAVADTGESAVLPALLAATASAVALDLVLQRWLGHLSAFPSGAILTGMIVGLVLSPTEPSWVPVVTSAIAIVSKHAFRTRFANVFNPAALALVASSLLFGSVQSWWGALPDLGPLGVVVLLATGVFIADRINKLPLVLVFLGTYFLLFTMASFLLEPQRVSEIFRSPDLEAGLFFAFFMADDPPTCPVKYGDQVLFGLIAATASYSLFVYNGAVYYLPAGLLLANAFEALRKSMLRSARRPAAA
jgi:Na+-translocating ferredoxin:NAD+ oxidoreductase RnfD subunit